MDLLHSQCC